MHIYHSTATGRFVERLRYMKTFLYYFAIVGMQSTSALAFCVVFLGVATSNICSACETFIYDLPGVLLVDIAW